MPQSVTDEQGRTTISMDPVGSASPVPEYVPVEAAAEREDIPEGSQMRPYQEPALPVEDLYPDWL